MWPLQTCSNLFTRDPLPEKDILSNFDFFAKILRLNILFSVSRGHFYWFLVHFYTFYGLKMEIDMWFKIRIWVIFKTSWHFLNNFYFCSPVQVSFSCTNKLATSHEVFYISIEHNNEELVFSDDSLTSIYDTSIENFEKGRVNLNFSSMVTNTHKM